jgi:hypothetical protein
MKKYYQCLLSKGQFIEEYWTVAWIPEKYAERYKILKLKEDNGTWSDGWVVNTIFGGREESFVLKHERDFVKQRESSDI